MHISVWVMGHEGRFEGEALLEKTLLFLRGIPGKSKRVRPEWYELFFCQFKGEVSTEEGRT